MRDAYGDALIEAGRSSAGLFVLDADCAASTRTQRFAERYPDRFANLGIAEQNMIGVAAGLASAGFRPVANSFAAMMVHRAHEQLMQSVGLAGADVLVAGHYAGLSSGVEGAPHHAVSDIALMRAIPGMAVWWPHDDAEARRLTTMLTGPGHTGPRYLRLERNPAPAQRPADCSSGAAHRWGRPARTALVCAGSVLAECLRAAERAEDEVSVIAVTRVEPLDLAFLRESLGPAESVVTVEEHRKVGGLASALLESGLLDGRVHIPHGLEGFTETGAPQQLRELYGLTAAALEPSLRKGHRPLREPNHSS